MSFHEQTIFFMKCDNCGNTTFGPGGESTLQAFEIAVDQSWLIVKGGKHFCRDCRHSEAAKAAWQAAEEMSVGHAERVHTSPMDQQDYPFKLPPRRDPNQ